MNRFSFAAPATALTLAFTLQMGAAHAVGTRTFQLDTQDRLAGGELKGVSIGSDGVVRVGATYGNTPLADASTIFATLAMADGSVLVGTGPSGKVYRIAQDQSQLFADTGGLAVTALVQGAGDTVYAATIPDGKIFKISQGKADLFATLPNTSYAWSLVYAKGGLYAAAGPEGHIFRIESNGTTSDYLKTDEPHLVSLAQADNGDLLVGSSGKALLMRVTGPGRQTVIADFAGDEVKAIAVSKGFTYAIVNEYSDPPELPKRGAAAGRSAPGPVNNPTRKPGKGALYRVDPKGRVERLMKHDEFHYTSLVLDDKGIPYVGTGAEGRVYSVDDNHTVTLVADTDERQIGSLAMTGKTPFFASSDPAVFHRITGRGGSEAVWTSKVLDCGLPARFGELSFEGTGSLELSGRSGNTLIPDGSWGAWSAPTRTGAKLAGAGRYVQVRARLLTTQSELREVTLPFVTDNARAIVTEVGASVRGLRTTEPVSSLPSSGGDLPKHEATVKVTWRVENPDNDALRYRVSVQREGQSLWRDLQKPDEFLTKTEFDWDTSTLSEGKYRVRVEASDEGVNAPGEALKHEHVSDPVLVDNTAPIIQQLEWVGRHLRIRATDAIGPIAKIDYALDGRTDFHPLAPIDGIFDAATESVDADLSSQVSAGPHLISVRVYDVSGNSILREIEVR